MLLFRLEQRWWCHWCHKLRKYSSMLDRSLLHRDSALGSQKISRIPTLGWTRTAVHCFSQSCWRVSVCVEFALRLWTVRKSAFTAGGHSSLSCCITVKLLVYLVYSWCDYHVSMNRSCHILSAIQKTEQQWFLTKNEWFHAWYRVQAQVCVAQSKLIAWCVSSISTMVYLCIPASNSVLWNCEHYTWLRKTHQKQSKTHQKQSNNYNYFIDVIWEDWFETLDFCENLENRESNH